MSEFQQNLNAICEKFGIAIDWTSDKMSEYIPVLTDKIARYNAISNGVTAFIFLLVSIVCAFVIVWDLTRMRKPYDIGEEYYMALFPIAVIIFIFALVSFLINLYDMIIAVTCPEMSALGYLRSFLSNVQA